MAAEGCVAAVMVVVMEPAVKSAAAVVVAAVHADAGPFVVEGAVEPFHLAVGGGVVGPGARVTHTELGTEVSPGEAAIAVAVVGEDPFDGDVEC